MNEKLISLANLLPTQAYKMIHVQQNLPPVFHVTEFYHDLGTNFLIIRYIDIEKSNADQNRINYSRFWAFRHLERKYNR